jgi:hypothetical protein
LQAVFGILRFGRLLSHLKAMSHFIAMFNRQALRLKTARLPKVCGLGYTIIAYNVLEVKVHHGLYSSKTQVGGAASSGDKRRAGN